MSDAKTGYQILAKLTLVDKEKLFKFITSLKIPELKYKIYPGMSLECFFWEVIKAGLPIDKILSDSNINFIDRPSKPIDHFVDMLIEMENYCDLDEYLYHPIFKLLLSVNHPILAELIGESKNLMEFINWMVQLGISPAEVSSLLSNFPKYLAKNPQEVLEDYLVSLTDFEEINNQLESDFVEISEN